MPNITELDYALINPDRNSDLYQDLEIYINPCEHGGVFEVVKVECDRPINAKREIDLSWPIVIAACVAGNQEQAGVCQYTVYKGKYITDPYDAPMYSVAMDKMGSMEFGNLPEMKETSLEEYNVMEYNEPGSRSCIIYPSNLQWRVLQTVFCIDGGISLMTLAEEQFEQNLLSWTTSTTPTSTPIPTTTLTSTSTSTPTPTSTPTTTLTSTSTPTTTLTSTSTPTPTPTTTLTSTSTSTPIPTTTLTSTSTSTSTAAMIASSDQWSSVDAMVSAINNVALQSAVEDPLEKEVKVIHDPSQYDIASDEKIGEMSGIDKLELVMAFIGSAAVGIIGAWTIVGGAYTCYKISHNQLSSIATYQKWLMGPLGMPIRYAYMLSPTSRPAGIPVERGVGMVSVVDGEGVVTSALGHDRVLGGSPV